jgi:hypothetical protein
MEWFIANWFWVLIFIAFVAMHMFGHGAHGSHSGHGGGDRKRSRDERDEAQGRVVNTGSGGHQPLKRLNSLALESCRKELSPIMLH